MKIYNNVFDKIVSTENLFLAWDNFKVGKTKKKDVQLFEWKLEENIFQLHRQLRRCSYKHGGYDSFYIKDPKQRHIHKAEVRDRVLHHAIFTAVNPVFEPTFISHSFSCRVGFGTHKGFLALEKFIRKVSSNYTKPCYVLKCDIKKFFDSVNHNILKGILKRQIKDEKAIWLLGEIVDSFSSQQSDIFNLRGLPIGNLTSQLFTNIYLNEFDQFIKNKLKLRYYARYTDDFVIIGNDCKELEKLLKPVRLFLEDKLDLKLHPNKIEIRKYNQGIDFLGFVALPHYRLIRTKTKKRAYRNMKIRIEEYRVGKINRQSLEQALQSYLGALSHANTRDLSQELLNQFWFWLTE